MRIKYNRVSTIGQTGNRFINDTEKYDLTLLDKVSGSIKFKDRPQVAKLIQLIEERKVSELIVEEFSRLGRNTGDVINTLDWLDERGVNVTVRNIGLQSRPNGIKNPLWKMVSSVMSSLYEMELINIKERTMIGRMVYLQQGGKLGRPKGTNESEKEFLEKGACRQITKYLQKGLTIREIAKVVGVSTTTVMKVKTCLSFLNSLSAPNSATKLYIVFMNSYKFMTICRVWNQVSQIKAPEIREIPLLKFLAKHLMQPRRNVL